MGKENDVYQFVASRIKQLHRESPWQKAMLAKLRRGVGKSPGEVPEVWEVTLENLPEALEGRGGEPSYAEWAIHISLTLYALHQQGKSEMANRPGVPFGAAVSRLIDSRGDNASAVKRRFDAVITAKNIDELSHHARGIIQMLKAKDVGFDYPRFAQDLYGLQFSHEKRRTVCLQWGRDFYKTSNVVSQERAQDAAQEGE
jgi:CRISPR system Cascade subunit CasB